MDSLETVWLLATLEKGGFLKRKGLENVDIVEVCGKIEEDAGMSLRRSSQLMLGTVLAFKKQCLWEWRDVKSVRTAMGRMGGIVVNLGGDIEENKGVTFLKDDPKFDISIGLMEEVQDDKGYMLEESQIGDIGIDIDDLDIGMDINGLDLNDFGDVNIDLDIGDLSERSEIANITFHDNANHNDATTHADCSHEISGIAFADNLNEIGLGMTTDIDIDNANITNTTDIEVPAQQATPPVTPIFSRKKQKIAIDPVVNMDIADIRRIRDGYISHELTILQKRYDAINQKPLPKFFNPYKFTSRLPSIETKRSRHSRSSSVSSIEAPRRAPSFNDFSPPPSYDMAHMEISLSANPDDFYNTLGPNSFFILSTKSETSQNFLFLLELASSGKVSVYQNHLFAQINIVKHN